MVSYTPPARYPAGLLGLPVPLVGETSEVKLKAWDAVWGGEVYFCTFATCTKVQSLFFLSLDFVTFHFHKSRGGESKKI